MSEISKQASEAAQEVFCQCAFAHGESSFHYDADRLIQQAIDEAVKAEVQPLLLALDDANRDAWSGDTTRLRVIAISTDKALALAKSRGWIEDGK